jgi:hypothetical protein
MFKLKVTAQGLHGGRNVDFKPGIGQVDTVENIPINCKQEDSELKKSLAALIGKEGSALG